MFHILKMLENEYAILAVVISIF